MADVADAFVGFKTLQDLIDRAADRRAGFDAQAATKLPRLALHPADVAKQAAVAPAVGVDVNGKNRCQRTLEHDLEFKRLHGAPQTDHAERQCSPRSCTRSVRKNGSVGNQASRALLSRLARSASARMVAGMS